MLNNEVKSYLENLDKIQKPSTSYISIDEFIIYEEIRKILNKDVNYEETFEDMAEIMAFTFIEAYPGEEYNRGTYYGPMRVYEDEKGQIVEDPSIQEVDEEKLEYWKKRAKESEHPILAARYADLVIDFSVRIINKSADINLFQIVIGSNIAICEKPLVIPSYCKLKIKRALDLAIQINNQEKITRVKNAIISLDKKMADDSKQNLWGFAFKWLILDFGEKITLTKTEKIELVRDLENRLKRIEEDVCLTEHAVSLLAEYYANKKDEDNLMRVLEILEKSYKRSTNGNSDILSKYHAYKEIHEIYQNYKNKRFPKLKNANDRILKEIGQLDFDLDKSLKEISIPIVEIKQEDIDAFLKKIFGDKQQNTLEVIIDKIVTYFLPKKESVKKELEYLYKRYPMSFLCTREIVDEDGVLKSNIPTLKDNYGENFQNYTSEYIQLGSSLLGCVIGELKKRISKQDIIEYLKKSMIFEDKTDKKHLERAILAYWDNDYIVSSSLFIPLIECSVRKLIKKCGGCFLKLNNVRGYDYITLHKLLTKKENMIRNVFGERDKNIVFYLRTVLTEKLGMNLRNDFAHGRNRENLFIRNTSDRLFHIILLLSSVKKNGERIENKQLQPR